MENDNSIAGVQNHDDQEGEVDTMCERRARFADAIDTIPKSRARVSKRDQIRYDRVRRLQHVAAFPCDETITYSVMTNGVRNNSINRRDIKTCQDMLGDSRYIAQGKTTMKPPSEIDADIQTVELLPEIITYYGSV